MAVILKIQEAAIQHLREELLSQMEDREVLEAKQSEAEALVAKLRAQLKELDVADVRSSELTIQLASQAAQLDTAREELAAAHKQRDANAQDTNTSRTAAWSAQ